MLMWPKVQKCTEWVRPTGPAFVPKVRKVVSGKRGSSIPGILDLYPKGGRYLSLLHRVTAVKISEGFGLVADKSFLWNQRRCLEFGVECEEGHNQKRVC